MDSREIQSIKQRFAIIGNDAVLNRAISVAARVANTNLSVLITGESGVGKEIFSQIIHKTSSRKHNEFIAVNCGAIPEGTIDSELFGHEKGAFTGAHDKRKGYFETVDGGTIFLDEIGELPVGTQARLLRVLESGEFIKVGSSQPQKTDVRVVAATNVDLLERIEQGKFREDLYYRLNTVPIYVPPLRESGAGEDILLLFRKFSSDFAEKNRTTSVKLDDQAKDLLLKFSWPGNVRQLKNIAEQVQVLASSEVVSAEELRDYIPDIRRSQLPALLSDDSIGNAENFSERELMYKVLFDMKKDITDLKRFVLEVTGHGQVPNYSDTPRMDVPPTINEPTGDEVDEPRTLVIHHPAPQDVGHAETVEESLSIADKEKELIVKALQKHRGRRKNAAKELGISERTLYRKIKEYEINE